MAWFVLRGREREEQEQEALAAASIVPIYATVSSGSCVDADFWGDDPGKESAEAWKEFLAIENDEWNDEKELDHARADIKSSPAEIGSSCERLVGNFCSKMSACGFSPAEMEDESLRPVQIGSEIGVRVQMLLENGERKDAHARMSRKDSKEDVVLESGKDFKDGVTLESGRDAEDMDEDSDVKVDFKGVVLKQGDVVLQQQHSNDLQHEFAKGVDVDMRGLKMDDQATGVLVLEHLRNNEGIGDDGIVERQVEDDLRNKFGEGTDGMKNVVKEEERPGNNESLLRIEPAAMEITSIPVDRETCKEATADAIKTPDVAVNEPCKLDPCDIHKCEPLESLDASSESIKAENGDGVQKGSIRSPVEDGELINDSDAEPDVNHHASMAHTDVGGEQEDTIGGKESSSTDEEDDLDDNLKALLEDDPIIQDEDSMESSSETDDSESELSDDSEEDDWSFTKVTHQAKRDNCTATPTGLDGQIFIDGSDEENAVEPPRSKNEIVDLPLVPKVEVTLDPSHKLLPTGIISSVLGVTVIVEGAENKHALDDGSILWLLEVRAPLGFVDEVFGPVKKPFYIVRFNDVSEIPEDAKVGVQVGYAPEFAKLAFNNPDLYQKGYDASGVHDEELSDEAYFSDDEKEAEYKRMKLSKHSGDHIRHNGDVEENVQHEWQCTSPSGPKANGGRGRGHAHWKSGLGNKGMPLSRKEESNAREPSSDLGSPYKGSRSPSVNLFPRRGAGLGPVSAGSGERIVLGSNNVRKSSVSLPDGSTVEGQACQSNSLQNSALSSSKDVSTSNIPTKVDGWVSSVNNLPQSRTPTPGISSSSDFQRQHDPSSRSGAQQKYSHVTPQQQIQHPQALQHPQPQQLQYSQHMQHPQLQQVQQVQLPVPLQPQATPTNSGLQEAPEIQVASTQQSHAMHQGQPQKVPMQQAPIQQPQHSSIPMQQYQHMNVMQQQQVQYQMHNSVTQMYHPMQQVHQFPQMAPQPQICPQQVQYAQGQQAYAYPMQSQPLLQSGMPGQMMHYSSPDGQFQMAPYMGIPAPVSCYQANPAFPQGPQYAEHYPPGYLPQYGGQHAQQEGYSACQFSQQGVFYGPQPANYTSAQPYGSQGWWSAGTGQWHQ